MDRIDEFDQGQLISRGFAATAMGKYVHNGADNLFLTFDGRSQEPDRPDVLSMIHVSGERATVTFQPYRVVDDKIAWHDPESKELDKPLGIIELIAVAYRDLLRNKERQVAIAP